MSRRIHPNRDQHCPLIRYVEEGHAAFRRGTLTSRYPLTSMPHKEWQRGWDIAYHENLFALAQTH
jgi:hypothetical protein